MQQARIPRGLVAFAGAACLLVGTAASSQETPIGPCRSLAQLGAAQIVDYNDPASSARIKIVEDYHFNDDVRALRKGQSSSVPADLDFVLRAIPNHYDALSAMGRWQVRNGLRSTDHNLEPADCYFRRAIDFKPQDARLHVAYGVYLHQSKRLQEAKHEYATAESSGAGDAELYYNYGLLLVEMGDVEQARRYAEQAYALGYPLPGLRNKLREQRSGR